MATGDAVNASPHLIRSTLPASSSWNQGKSTAISKALDAFDLYRILQYGGDYRAAVRAAANSLGLNRAAA
jgi:hypothetical protein